MSRKKGSKSRANIVLKSKARGFAARHPSPPPPAQHASPALRPMASRPTAAFDASKKLRHMPIHFVSAGRLQGTIEERPPAVRPALVAANLDLNPNSGSIAHSSSSSSSSSSSPLPENTAAMAQMALRSPSPPRSVASSSGDEVVFRGRHQEPLIAPHTAQLSIRPKSPTRVNSALDTDSDGVAQEHFAQRRGSRPTWEGTTTEWQHRSKPNVGWLPNRDRPDMRAFLRGEVNPRDAAMADYMQNMEEYGLTVDANAPFGFPHREMDLDAGSHNDWESASDSHGKESDHPKQREQVHKTEEPTQTPDELYGSWDSDRIHDLADLSTSSDVMENVVRILAKRTRKSGLHYLCVYQGAVSDDAHWLPYTFLRTSAEKKLVRTFEEQVDLREQQQSSSSDLVDADEDEDEDEGTDEDTDEEEAYNDEVIARVLQKQEELGLGSDQVLLYAGDQVFDTPISSNSSTFGIHARSNKQRQSRGRGNREPSFPSASAMADALSMDPYGGFDIMDTERPSLRPKKKGRRGQMPAELDELDLYAHLQSTWENDKEKKRLKKAEREELRQEGLLGRKDKAPDLKVKYAGGIAMEDVVEEIREFLMGNMQTLALPPMDANRRATIHQVASFFNLTSRSRGQGQSRFTVLARTARTRDYTDDEFDIAIRHKGFLKRLRGPLTTEGGARKGGSFRQGARHKPPTGYKDGETVGANAPALGPENKGHALLSKMGWSKGMGLGALDNKGILQPITHTVKITKAGLQ